MSGRMRDAGVVFVGNIVARALGFLFPLVLVHSVTKTDFGTVMFIVMTGWFASSLVLNGFAAALTRHLAAGGPADEAPWLSSAVVGGMPVVVVAVVFGETLAWAAGAPAGLMTVMVLGLAIDAYFWGLLRGLGRFPLMVGYRVAANVLQLALLAAVVVADVGSVWIAVAIYASVYVLPIAVIEVWAAPIRGALAGRLRPDAACVRKLGGYAAPAVVAGLGYAVMITGDSFFVEVLSPGALPDYATAKALAQPITVVSYALGVVILPGVAQATEERRWQQLRSALIVAVVAGGAITLAYRAVDGAVVRTLLPPSYASALEVLPVLVAGLALLGVVSVLGEWWNGLGHPLVPTAALGSGAVVTVGLQLLLTPAGGGRGASFALMGGAAAALAVLGGLTAARWVRWRREAGQEGAANAAGAGAASRSGAAELQRW